MKTLATLIRLAGHRTDEARRMLKAALDAEAVVVDKIAALDGRVARERDAARADPSLGANLPLFLDRAHRDRKALEGELALKRQGVEAARQALAEAFEEQKKYEIGRDNAEARAAREADRREQLLLDEMGLRGRGGGR